MPLQGICLSLTKFSLNTFIFKIRTNGNLTTGGYNLKRLILAAMAISLIATPLLATTVVDMDFDKQAISADVVIVGNFVKSEPIKWRGYPCTKVYVSVDEIIAGTISGTEVAIIEPGAGNYHVVGAKHLQKGETYLLFLEKLPDGFYRTVGFNQGAHQVTTEKTTARKVVTVRETRKLSPGMTLDEARKRIRAVREASGKNGAQQ